MKVIIDIPEDIYNDVKNLGYIYAVRQAHFLERVETITQAIINSTPLPKEYEKLVDVGQCDRELFYQQCGGADSLITVKLAFDMLMSLPAIIEANKGEKKND